jgi:hypothetical protein
LNHIGRFLGWLKGYIHNRNHSSANLVNGYARATLSRRAPEKLRRGLLARCASNNVCLPPSSFLHNASDRLASRRRPGGHYVEVKLSRRNNKVVHSPRTTEVKLWKFLKKYVVHARRKQLLEPPANDVHIIEVISKGKASVVMNAQPVRVNSWFQYNALRESVGKVERIFVVNFGSSTARAGREVIVYMRRFHSIVSRDDTDFEKPLHLLMGRGAQ